MSDYQLLTGWVRCHDKKGPFMVETTSWETPESMASSGRTR